MALYEVRQGAAISPGTVAHAKTGDVVRVHYSATARHDWAPFAHALMTAFVRGAEVVFEGGNSPESPAKFSQVRGGVS